MLILQLFWLQVKYLTLLVWRTGVCRFFWRALAYQGRSADRYLSPSLRYALPLRDLESVIPGLEESPFTLINFRDEFGGVSLREAQILTQSIRMLKPRTLFEFGTFNGGSTVQFAANAPPDGVVHTIDLAEDDPLRGNTCKVDVTPEQVGRNYRGTTWESKIRQLYGDTAKFDCSPFRSSCDWIFIDASHAYECVAADTRTAIQMIRPGGIIFWHDCVLAFPGVCQALEELAREHPVFRIPETSLGCLVFNNSVGRFGSAES